MPDKKDLFAPLNEMFDKIYVLTLKRSTDRQESVKQVLDGLNWSFHWGVDKHDLDMEALKRDGIYDEATHVATKRTHRGMTLAEIACALSHREIWQDAVDNGYQRILVFEDDVIPCFEALKRFTTELQELPQDWDAMMLGYYDPKENTWQGRLQLAWYKLCHKLHLANWNKFPWPLFDMLLARSYSASYNYVHKAVGAHAYALNLETAKHYVEYQTPVIIQADRVFLYYQLVEELKVYMPKDPYFSLSELSKISEIQWR